MAKLRVALHTVGCRANQADTAWLARRLDPAIVEVVPFAGGADLYVVNSCAVTSAAERDVRKAVARARRWGGRVLLAGCMVTADEEATRALGPALWRAVPSFERRGLPALVHALARGGEPCGGPEALHPLPDPLRRARPILRVQDGCERRCAYCAVPAGRGPERSMPLDEVFERLSALESEGAQEVVVCGVNLGAWGRDLSPRARVADLAAALEERAPVSRIRLSSIEPWAVDAPLRAVLGEARRIAPHLHLPLQSGDDGVLRRMGRPSKASDLEDLLRDLLAARPGLAVGVDALAGFPGEDDAAFGRTLSLLERLPLAYVHAFGFSPRPGTRAASMADRVPPAQIRRRVAALRRLSETKRRAFAASLVGRVLRAVLEPARPGEGARRGMTGPFVAVWLPAEGLPPEGLVAVRVESLLDGGALRAVPCTADLAGRGSGSAGCSAGLC